MLLWIYDTDMETIKWFCCPYHHRGNVISDFFLLTTTFFSKSFLFTNQRVCALLCIKMSLLTYFFFSNYCFWFFFLSVLFITLPFSKSVRCSFRSLIPHLLVLCFPGDFCLTTPAYSYSTTRYVYPASLFGNFLKCIDRPTHQHSIIAPLPLTFFGQTW